jgi:alcohol dehydrogenase YqhD (iron-dependent ADH family)
MSILNFTAYNPTRLHFGEGVIENLGRRTKNYGTKALLVTCKGSVKKYGYFDIVVQQLENAGIEVVVYSGIKPNPIVEDVREASELGRKEKVDVVVALGGGSAVDSAKIIALSVASGYDAWDIMKYKAKPLTALPLICVLTLAATGTEMNGAAVVQNHATMEKVGYVNELIFPKESFLEPSFTNSVPKNYTAYGIVDLIAHALEAYFGEGEPEVIDDITFAIIRDAMKWGPLLLNDLTNTDLRAKILLDSTLALNGITRYGKINGDWGVHGIGHELSLLYDMPHGATLSIAYIAWLKLHKARCPERIIKLGQNLFGVDNVDETIELLAGFFKTILSPVSLVDEGIDFNQSTEIEKQLAVNGVSGMHYQLSKEDYSRITNYMFEN